MSESSTTSELMVENLIEQIGSLLYYRECLLRGSHLHDIKKARVSEEEKNYVANAQQIKEADLSNEKVNEQLDSLQKKIILLSATHLSEILEYLNNVILIKISNYDQPTRKKKKKDLLKPIKVDSRVFDSFEKFEEQSIQFFVLKTYYYCFEYINQRKLISKFKSVPKRLVEVIFNFLNFDHSPAIRFTSSRCLIHLSTYNGHFETITHLFNEFLGKKFKKSQITQLALHEETIQNLNWTLRGPVPAEITIKFLDNYTYLLKKISSEVRREEVCKTLVTIFKRIYPKSTKLRKDEREIEKSQQIKRIKKKEKKLHNTLASSFETSYEIVKKWSKKSKSHITCWKLLVKFLQYCDHAFFSFDNHKRIDEILSFLQGGLKNKETRIDSLRLLNKLIKNYHPKSIKLHESSFLNHIKEILPLVLLDHTKKAQYLVFQEIDLIAELFVTISVKNLGFGVDRISENLKEEKLRSDYKIALCKSLEKICIVIDEDDVIEYNQILHPIIEKILMSTKSFSSGIAKEAWDHETIALIRTFPIIIGEYVEREEIFLKRLISFALSKNDKISEASFKAIERYLLLDSSEGNDGTFFNYCVFPLLSRLENISYFYTSKETDEDGKILIIKMFKLLKLIVNTFSRFLKNEKKNFQCELDYKTWGDFKIRFENCCIIWLSYENYDLHTLIKEILMIMPNGHFKKLSNDLYEKKKKLDFKRKEKKKKKQRQKEKDKKKKRRRKKVKSSSSEEEESGISSDDEINEKINSMDLINRLNNFLHTNALPMPGSGLKKIKKQHEWLLLYSQWIWHNYKSSTHNFICISNLLSQALTSDQIKKKIVEMNTETKYEKEKEKAKEKKVEESNKGKDDTFNKLYFNLLSMLCAINRIPKTMELIPETLDIRLLEKDEQNNSEEEEHKRKRRFTQKTLSKVFANKKKKKKEGEKEMGIEFTPFDKKYNHILLSNFYKTIFSLLKEKDSIKVLVLNSITKMNLINLPKFIKLLFRIDMENEKEEFNDPNLPKKTKKIIVPRYYTNPIYMNFIYNVITQYPMKFIMENESLHSLITNIFAVWTNPEFKLLQKQRSSFQIIAIKTIRKYLETFHHLNYSKQNDLQNDFGENEEEEEEEEEGEEEGEGEDDENSDEDKEENDKKKKKKEKKEKKRKKKKE
ncbi:stress response protein nst1 [Anaeramoeba flamelloides]|uniref:Stress response protein nst1 n=1 Tax=Anaeramoeba flamelloides TaxID=1746091 RepID=A0ABQ8Z5D7_9EUKA|nr:stress response protein nst1 [Anaeramoeba flamelloides]